MARKIKVIFFTLVLISTLVMSTSAATTVQIVYGDLDGSKSIDLGDLLLLKKHLAYYEIDINESATDLDGDGVSGLSDLLLLKKYLAHWDVSVGDIAVIKFDTDGGNSLSDAYVSVGTTLEEIPIPTKQGKTFVKWVYDNKDFNQESIVIDDMTLKAIWK